MLNRRGILSAVSGVALAGALPELNKAIADEAPTSTVPLNAEAVISALYKSVDGSSDFRALGELGALLSNLADYTNSKAKALANMSYYKGIGTKH